MCLGIKTFISCRKVNTILTNVHSMYSVVICIQANFNLLVVLGYISVYSEYILLAGVIGSDVPWLECPACNALTWVITVTE